MKKKGKKKNCDFVIKRYLMIFINGIKIGISQQENIRKCYICLIVFFIATVQLVELQAAENIVNYLQEFREENQNNFNCKFYSSIAPSRIAEIISFLIMSSLLFYKFSNSLLNILYKNNKLLLSLALIIINILLFMPSCFTIAETLYVLLIASCFYRPKGIKIFNGGGHKQNQWCNEYTQVKKVA